MPNIIGPDGNTGSVLRIEVLRDRGAFLGLWSILQPNPQNVQNLLH